MAPKLREVMYEHLTNRDVSISKKKLHLLLYYYKVSAEPEED